MALHLPAVWKITQHCRPVQVVWTLPRDVSLSMFGVSSLAYSCDLLTGNIPPDYLRVTRV